MKSLFKKVIVSVLAISLIASSIVLNKVEAAEKKQVELKIKKVLQIPKEGVKVPNETFTFTFTQHSFNGDTGNTSFVGVNPITLRYSSADTGTMKNDKNQVIKTTTDALAKVKFPKGGQYTYTVKETKGSTDGMVYSQVQYLVSIFVTKFTDDSYKPSNIMIKKSIDETGKTASGQTKVNYTEDTVRNESNFVFINNYDPTTGNNNPSGKDIQPNDKKGFVLKKEITGAVENNKDLAETFTFKLKAEKPEASNSKKTQFKYKIVKQTGNADNEASQNYGADFFINLKHGERIVFYDLLLGSKISAKESEPGAYTPQIKNTSKMNGKGSINLDTMTGGLVAGDHTDGNAVIFENTLTTPTDALINNIPFIILAIIVFFGILFFIKNRRTEEE